ncbi:hypothetical protein ACVWZD_000418 [Streptomyces sp. TE3672]
MTLYSRSCGQVHAWDTSTGPLANYDDGDPIAVATVQELCPAGARPVR